MRWLRGSFVPGPDAKASRIEEGPVPSVFLCHASDDKPAVRKLWRRLRADNVAPWLDEEDLIPGQVWANEIPLAVRAADIVLVCLSPVVTTKHGYLQKEIRDALDVAEEKAPGTIFIIPVLLEPCEVPERLRRWQWVELFREGGYEKLLRALHDGRVSEFLNEEQDEASSREEEANNASASNLADETAKTQAEVTEHCAPNVTEETPERKAAGRERETETELGRDGRQVGPDSAEEVLRNSRVLADTRGFSSTPSEARGKEVLEPGHSEETPVDVARRDADTEDELGEAAEDDGVASDTRRTNQGTEDDRKDSVVVGRRVFNWFIGLCVAAYVVFLALFFIVEKLEVASEQTDARKRVQSESSPDAAPTLAAERSDVLASTPAAERSDNNLDQLFGEREREIRDRFEIERVRLEEQLEALRQQRLDNNNEFSVHILSPARTFGIPKKLKLPVPELAELMTSAGFPAFIQLRTSMCGTDDHVHLGVYGSRAEAERVLAFVKEQFGYGGAVVVVKRS